MLQYINMDQDQDVTPEYHPSGPNGSQDARIKSAEWE